MTEHPLGQTSPIRTALQLGRKWRLLSPLLVKVLNRKLLRHLMISTAPATTVSCGIVERPTVLGTAIADFDDPRPPCQ